MNGVLFALLRPHFGRRAAGVLSGYEGGEFRFSPVAEQDIERLSRFLTSQPAERMRYFNPHGFDTATLRRLHRNPAFVMMKAENGDGTLAGYFFLRCFFTGKAFHGLAASEQVRGCGLGRQMWYLSSKICAAGGVRMLATVSEQNVPSLVSARQGTHVTVVERLFGNYLLIECKPEE